MDVSLSIGGQGRVALCQELRSAGWTDGERCIQNADAQRIDLAPPTRSPSCCAGVIGTLLANERDGSMAAFIHRRAKISGFQDLLLSESPPVSRNTRNETRRPATTRTHIENNRALARRTPCPRFEVPPRLKSIGSTQHRAHALIATLDSKAPPSGYGCVRS